jgi:hypothetical protein
MGSENVHRCAQNVESGFSFDYKDSDEFFNHIMQVTGDYTWVSFVDVETKEQSKQRMHTHSPNKPKCLNTRQKAYGN